MSSDALLSGAKGGGGGSTFRNRPDNLRSTDTYEMLLGLAGSRARLAPGGLKNLFVDDVPVEDGEGNPVFKDFQALVWDGDPTILAPVKLKLGQSGGQVNVGVQIANAYTSGAPGDWVTAAMTTTGAEFLDLRFVVQQLYKQTKKGVDNQTATIEIELRPSGASNWINPLLDTTAPTYNVDGIGVDDGAFTKTMYAPASKWATPTTWKDSAPGYLKITGKTTSAYVKELRIAVPSTGAYGGKTWEVRCRLIERDSVISGTDGENEDKRLIQWESIAGVNSDVIGNTEAWRGLSYVQIYGKATDQISGLPEVTGIYDFGEYAVPPSSVWDPVTRAYTGATWDGVTTQVAWTQCPAWQIKGLIEDGLSGISALVPGSTMNKWDVLEASKWFAQLVPDGKGGQQPRYSMNWFIEEPMQTHELVNYLAGAVGAFAWDEGDGRWRMKVEKPETPQIIFTKEMIEGEFYYAHTDVDTRFNSYTGVFRNKDNRYNEDRVRVFDQSDIDATGLRHTTVALVGCDNRQEAIRRLEIRKLTSLNETKTVTFTTNRIGVTLEPLSVIAIADGDLNSDTTLRSTGRIIALDEARTKLTVRDPLRLEVGVAYKAKFTVPNLDYNPETTIEPDTPEWRKPTITIERTIVNTAAQRGDIYDLYLDEALPDNLPEFAPVALEAVGLPALPKQYRVTDIQPSEDGLKATISAIEIYTSKWVESDGITEEEINNQSVNRAAPPPIAPDGGMVMLENFPSGNGTRTVLTVRWLRPASIFVDDYRVEYQHNGGPWLGLGSTRDTYYEMNNPAEGDYLFRVYMRDRRGVESVPLEGSISVDPNFQSDPLYIFPDQSGFTYVDGVLTPAEQTITLTAKRNALPVYADWSTEPNIKSAATSKTLAISAADLGTNHQVVVTATVEGISVTYSISKLADAGATIGAPEGTPVAGRPAELVVQSIDSLTTDVGDLQTMYGDVVSAADSAAQAEQALSDAQAAMTQAQAHAADSASYADAASGSATAAQGYASAADASSSSAASFAQVASTTATALLPERTDAQGHFFRNSTGAADLYTSASVLNHPTQGLVLVTNFSGAVAVTDGYVQAVPGRTYEVEVEVYANWTTASGTLRTIVYGYDESENFVGYAVGNVKQTGVTAGQTYTYTDRFGANGTGNVLAWPVGVTRIRFGGNFAGDAATGLYVKRVRVRDVTSQAAAESSASAAATSAATASTKATEAGQSASAASTSATNASTYAGNASTYATNASTSATTAQGYANSASTSATLAANSFNDAIYVAGNTRFDPNLGLLGWVSQDDGVTGPYGKTPTNDWYIAQAWGEGNFLIVNPNTQLYVFSKKLYQIDPSRRYKVSCRIGAYLNGVGEGEVNSTCYAGFAAYDGAGNIVDHGAFGSYRYAATGGGATLGDGQITTFEHVVTGTGNDDWYKFPPGTAQVRLMAILNYAELSPLNTYMSHLTIEDVELQEQAATSASAASTSAASASNSAAAALASATLSASVAANLLNPNANFAAWPDGNAMPDNWGVAYASGSYSKRTVNGRPAVRVSVPAGGQNEFANQCLAGGMSPGWYVLEVDLEVVSGQIGGSGVRFQTYNAAVAVLESQTYGFFDTPDINGKVLGATPNPGFYSWRVLVERSHPDTSLYYIGVSAGGLWGTLAGTSDMAFYRVGFRPATPQEIRDQTVLQPMEATVKENSGALAAINGRTTAYWQVEANAGSGAAAFISARADTSQPEAAPVTFITEANTYANGRTIGATTSAPDWTNGVASEEFYTGSAYIAATPATTSVISMIGLMKQSGLPSDYSSINYAWYWAGDGNWYIYESGVNISSAGAGKVTDVATIEYDAGVVTYKLNGRIKRTATDGSSETFRLACAMASSGDCYKNVVFGPSGPTSASTISMGAAEFSIYNPADGGWIKAMTMENGNALFSGGLQAGAYIRLGNGEGWPVALKARDFQVSDGDVVSFGTTLDALPSMIWQKNNLVALSSGETYNVYAENLSTTGFTARVKIFTPAAPTNYSLTVSTAPGTGPTRQIDKSTNPDAIDGNYTLTFAGSCTISGTKYL